MVNSAEGRLRTILKARSTVLCASQDDPDVDRLGNYFAFSNPSRLCMIGLVVVYCRNTRLSGSRCF